mmetsp:Transcript_5688/g.17492  ORF Transcript_5688/g.17492 Transcript_5688/m.17492 type:complete len:229 (-) Transcript_5688:537-1223(-)
MCLLLQALRSPAPRRGKGGQAGHQAGRNRGAKKGKLRGSRGRGGGRGDGRHRRCRRRCGSGARGHHRGAPTALRRVGWWAKQRGKDGRQPQHRQSGYAWHEGLAVDAGIPRRATCARHPRPCAQTQRGESHLRRAHRGEGLKGQSRSSGRAGHATSREADRSIAKHGATDAPNWPGRGVRGGTRGAAVGRQASRARVARWREGFCRRRREDVGPAGCHRITSKRKGSA